MKKYCKDVAIMLALWFCILVIGFTVCTIWGYVIVQACKFIWSLFA